MKHPELDRICACLSLSHTREALLAKYPSTCVNKHVRIYRFARNSVCGVRIRFMCSATHTGLVIQVERKIRKGVLVRIIQCDVRTKLQNEYQLVLFKRFNGTF